MLKPSELGSSLKATCPEALRLRPSVGVRAEVCHGLVVILGVEGDTARGEVGDGPVGSHNPHPQHMLSSTTVKRINYLWDPTDRANHK